MNTTENALSANLKPSGEEDALQWPRPVHRLDYPTSGLLLIAKTKSSQIELGNMLENKQVKKRYRAIVMGEIPSGGTINEPVGGRSATSEY